MVYYGGPDRYHASYAVRVIPIDLSRLENSGQHDKSMLNGFSEFTQFSSLIRINETVSKVIYKKDFYYINIINNYCYALSSIRKYVMYVSMKSILSHKILNFKYWIQIL